jgi:hypothetical protein
MHFGQGKRPRRQDVGHWSLVSRVWASVLGLGPENALIPNPTLAVTSIRPGSGHTLSLNKRSLVLGQPRSTSCDDSPTINSRRLPLNNTTGWKSCTLMYLLMSSKWSRRNGSFRSEEPGSSTTASCRAERVCVGSTSTDSDISKKSLASNARRPGCLILSDTHRNCLKS